MASETNPSGHTISYDYDDFGRLSKIRDLDKNLTDEFKYHYQGAFISKEYSGEFTRTTCSEGYQAGIITYTLPSGSETSLISQEDADQKALVKWQQEGQQKADSSGPCYYIYYSKEFSNDFTRNNCSEGSQGGTISYTLPVGSETSIISQEDADQKASTRFRQEGQTLANNTALCSTYNVFITTTSTDLPVFSIKFKKVDGTVVRTVNSDLEQLPISFYLPEDTYTIDIDAMEPMNAIVNGSAKKIPPIASWNISTLSQVNINLKKVSEVYYNYEQRLTFSKNDCSSGFGSDVTYKVPAGKYISYESQADANNQAIAAAREYGQSNANTHGYCFDHMLTVQYESEGNNPMRLVVTDGEKTIINTGILDRSRSYSTDNLERGKTYHIHMESMYRAQVTVNGNIQVVAESPGEWNASAPIFIKVVKIN